MRTLSALFLALVACDAGLDDTQTDTSENTDITEEIAADAVLAADLAFLREEEKLARDTYLTLYEVFGLGPHQNIARSEQTHMDLVLERLTALGLPDPVTDDTVGTFVNPDLAQLYAELVAQGSASEEDALLVGATIEDLDIRDIQSFYARTDDAEVLAIYANLECGSRNHLRSFASQLSSRGIEYQAQFLTAEEVSAIVTSARETCAM